MGKIGTGLLGQQKKTRESSGFVKTEKAVDLNAVLKSLGREPQDWHSFKKGTKHFINILPWKITSKDDIAVKMKGDFHRDLGTWVYSLNIWVHKLDDHGKFVACPKKCLGKPCKYCEEADAKWEKWRNGDKESEAGKAMKAQANSFTAKLRSMYNFEVLTEDLKGINSFHESSDYIFEDELIKAATDVEEGEVGIPFYEPGVEEGKVVKFSTGARAMDPCELFKFNTRKRPVSKALMAGVIKFGEHVQIPTTKEMEALFYGEDIDGDNDVEEKATPDVSDDDDYDGYDDDDEAVEDTAEEVAADDGDVKCPSGHKIGADFGKHDECDECELERDCWGIKKALKK